jgi:hypothetical protein
MSNRDGRLQVSPVKATITPEGRAFADVIEAMMPRVRITELLHEVRTRRETNESR